MKKALLIAICLTGVLNLHLKAQYLSLVKEISRNSFGSAPSDFTVSNNKLFFLASTPELKRTLWVSDGTDAGTSMIPLPEDRLNVIRELVSFKDRVFFSFNDGVHGQELWVTDGTEAGTYLFADLYKGTAGSHPYAFMVANNKLIFIANNEDGERRLYATDGTVSGTEVIRNKSCNTFNGKPKMPIFGNEVYFQSGNPSGYGYGFWKTDGTAAGTVIVKTELRSTGEYIVLKDKMLFAGSDDRYGGELWITDGTEGGTKLVKNISPNDGGGIFYNSNPQGFSELNGKAYFAANDGVHGMELWRSDGTEAGTTLVKDINAGPYGSLPYHSIKFNNKLYIICWSPDELWESDGTEEGTKRVETLPQSAHFAAAWNNKMYIFSAMSPRLFESDGTSEGTHYMVVSNSIYNVFYESSDMTFTEFNGDLYFSGRNYEISPAYNPVRLSQFPLPLKLLSFSGDVRNGNDFLTWDVAQEGNYSKFILQQTTDFVTYKTVTTLEGKGSGTKSYSFQQPSSKNESGHYRLTLIDEDGKVSYSSIIKLARTGAKQLKAWYDYSNRQLKIKNDNGENCNWAVVSQTGAIIKTGSSKNSFIQIDAGHLPSGIYFLKYQTRSANGSEKVFISK